MSWGNELDIDEQMGAFAANMRAARLRSGLTQARLSEAAGLDRTAVSLLERAKRSPDLGTLLKITRALETRPVNVVDGMRAPFLHGRARRGRASSGDPAVRLGANLRRARTSRKIAQEALAVQAGVDRAAISTYEQGRRAPNLRTVVRLAHALGLPAAALFDGVE